MSSRLERLTLPQSVAGQQWRLSEDNSASLGAPVLNTSEKFTEIGLFVVNICPHNIIKCRHIQVEKTIREK